MNWKKDRKVKRVDFAQRAARAALLSAQHIRLKRLCGRRKIELLKLG